MRKWRKTVLGAISFLVGAALFFYPTVVSVSLNKEAEAYIQQFEKEKNVAVSETARAQNKEEDPLYQSFRQYNAVLAQKQQRYFTDPWSCVQVPGELEEIDVESLGYIEIPAMELRLPLGIGASEQNLARGAAILGQTSLPVGGADTNCVIAGHRGYKGAPYFRDIEKLKKGDEVLLYNCWEILRYCVESTEVIDPRDSEKVKIQPQRDMVTLLTCHPYRSGGKYRYVVYCVRADTEAEPEETGNTFCGADSAVPFVPSEPDIRREHIVRKISAAALVLMVCILLQKKIKAFW